MVWVTQAVITAQEEVNDKQFVGQIALFTADGAPFDLSDILEKLEDLETRVAALENPG